MLRLRNIHIVALVLVFLMVSVVEAQRPRRPFQRPGGRMPDKLKAGDEAPDFTLNVMDGAEDETVTLSDFAGDRPVALVFGSYT